MKRFILAGVSAVVLAGAARTFADVVVMEDGRRIRGELVSINRGLVLFDEIAEGSTRKNRLRLERDQVARILLRDEAERGGGRSAGGRDDDWTRDEGRDRDDAPYGGRDRDDARDGRNRDDDDDDGDGDDRDEDVLYRGGNRGTRDDGDDRRGDTADSRDDSGRGQAITVSARRAWTDTGIDVRTGDILSFSPEGTVQWGPGREDGPAGEMNSPIDRRRPIPARPGGALIGRIGTSASDVFFIGNDRGSFRVRSGGRLYLGVNDADLGDNSGSFQVRISR